MNLASGKEILIEWNKRKENLVAMWLQYIMLWMQSLSALSQCIINTYYNEHYWMLRVSWYHFTDKKENKLQRRSYRKIENLIFIC